MSSCASCGHPLGVGRFCTNCGAPVDSSVAVGASGDDWRTDTAERRLPRTLDPRTPPSAVAPPPPPRYPLYADEVDDYAPYGPLGATETQVAAEADHPVGAGVHDPAHDQAHDHPAAPDVEPEEHLGFDQEYVYDDERRSPVLWILIAALVLILVGVGWWFLVRDDGAGGASEDGGSGSSTEGTTSEELGVDVAGRASARAPQTAPPNEDVNGDQVSYDASNMLDGVPTTAWRAPGDATGMSLTFTLREPTELHRVGIINGYAKTSTDGQDRTFDWYLGNRRVNAVVWVFDDGTKVRQQLTESRELQTLDVDVVTGKVVLKLVRVSAPGAGTAARNYTAVSEVSLVGEPT